MSLQLLNGCNYVFSVYQNDSKPINDLSAAIESGDKISFTGNERAVQRFDSDKIGWCKSNEIKLLEKGKSNYSGLAERDEK